MPTYTYAAKAEPAQGMSLDPVKLISGFCGVVTRTDDAGAAKVVWRGAMYGDARAAVLPANRALKGFRDYLAKNGRCWFDDRAQVKATWQAWRKQRVGLVEALSRAAARGVADRLAGKMANEAAAGLGFKPGTAEYTIYLAAFDQAGDLPPEPPKDIGA
jgi:hypothetical protein